MADVHKAVIGTGRCDEEGHWAVGNGRPVHVDGFFSDVATLEPVLEDSSYHSVSHVFKLRGS